MKINSPRADKGPHRDPAKERSWRQLLQQFASSGQSIREFCAANHLKETAFYFWRAEIQRRDGRAPGRKQPSTPHPVSFARVLVQEPQPMAEQGPCLRLGDGRELLLPVSWTPAQLAAVVHAIEREGGAA